MSDWTGSASSLVVTPEALADCVQYLSVADVRAEYGDHVAELTDAQLQRKIDRLVASLEDNLGHSFGRALAVRSTAADTVSITATECVIGGDTYAFADYPTLHDLATAANAAGEAYSVEILPHVYASTPSALLAQRAAVVCGPDYEDRVVLCLSARYDVLDGDYTSHVFLPLPIASINSIYESGLLISATGYWYKPGDVWVIKKQCACATATVCRHPRGRWLASYPNNIAVTWTPQWFGRVPQSLSGLLLEAFESQAGLGPMESESFGGEYSYKRAARAVATPWETLGGGVARQYAVRFQP